MKISKKFVAIFLIVLGLLLMAMVPLKNYLVQSHQQQAVSQITKATVKRNRKKKGDFQFDKVHEIGIKQAATTYKQDPLIIGRIQIPSVGLNLPINKGLSDVNMSTGACTMRPNQVMGKGNYPLAGHYMTNNGALFSPLENTQIGQNIYITDLNHTYTYKIYSKKIVDPHDVYLVNNTKKPIITLITCANGGSMRWCIRGVLQ